MGVKEGYLLMPKFLDPPLLISGRLQVYKSNQSHRIIWSWYIGRWWVGRYIWYSDEGTGRGGAGPQPSTSSVPITVLLYNGPLLCGFSVLKLDLPANGEECVRCVCETVVFTQHTELGLEERRQRCLPGRTQTGLYRSELFGARILHAHGESLYDEIVQSGKWLRSIRNISNAAAAAAAYPLTFHHFFGQL